MGVLLAMRGPLAAAPAAISEQVASSRSAHHSSHLLSRSADERSASQARQRRIRDVATMCLASDTSLLSSNKWLHTSGRVVIRWRLDAEGLQAKGGGCTKSRRSRSASLPGSARHGLLHRRGDGHVTFEVVAPAAFYLKAAAKGETWVPTGICCGGAERKAGHWEVEGQAAVPPAFILSPPLPLPPSPSLPLPLSPSACAACGQGTHVDRRVERGTHRASCRHVHLVRERLEGLHCREGGGGKGGERQRRESERERERERGGQNGG
eukprot:scaffold146662_cov28-Tisochrysis_lutea.AAC.1